eukprot:m.187896 g.187896  ORF g.187896 m.187896 type:complete len:735 (-) comp32320_c0_seq1:183-2387(-)
MQHGINQLSTMGPSTAPSRALGHTIGSSDTDNVYLRDEDLPTSTLSRVGSARGSRLRQVDGWVDETSPLQSRKHSDQRSDRDRSKRQLRRSLALAHDTEHPVPPNHQWEQPNDTEKSTHDSTDMHGRGQGQRQSMQPRPPGFSRSQSSTTIYERPQSSRYQRRNSAESVTSLRRPTSARLRPDTEHVPMFDQRRSSAIDGGLFSTTTTTSRNTTNLPNFLNEDKSFLPPADGRPSSARPSSTRPSSAIQRRQKSRSSIETGDVQSAMRIHSARGKLDSNVVETTTLFRSRHLRKSQSNINANDVAEALASFDDLSALQLRSQRLLKGTDLGHEADPPVVICSRTSASFITTVKMGGASQLSTPTISPQQSPPPTPKQTRPVPKPPKKPKSSKPRPSKPEVIETNVPRSSPSPTPPMPLSPPQAPLPPITTEDQATPPTPTPTTLSPPPSSTPSPSPSLSPSPSPSSESKSPVVRAMKVMKRKLTMGVITQEEFDVMAKVHAAAVEDCIEKDDIWSESKTDAPSTTGSDTVSNNTTLNYLADVSVIPVEKLEFYNEVFEMSRNKMGDAMSPTEFVQNIRFLDDGGFMENEVCFVMYVFARVDKEGNYYRMPRDYRMYPVASLLEKILVQRATLQRSLSRLEKGTYNPEFYAVLEIAKELFELCDRKGQGVVPVRKIIEQLKRHSKIPKVQVKAASHILTKLFPKEVHFGDYLAGCPILCELLLNPTQVVPFSMGL